MTPVDDNRRPGVIRIARTRAMRLSEAAQLVAESARAVLAEALPQ